MSEWQTYKLGDLCEIYDGPHATPPKQKGGFIFLGISSLNYDGRIDSSQFEYISEEYFKKWTKRVQPRDEDIVFSYETKLGTAAIIPPNFTCCLGRRMGLLRADKTKIIPKFLLYAYLSPEFQKTIYERTFHGSTVDRIPLRNMFDFPIEAPDIEEQKAIVSVLSSLDNKIDLLHRQNITLERMAETLFRRWFVEEAQGDWEERPLSSIANFLNGLACQKFTPTDAVNKLPVLKIKELSSGISENSDWATSNLKPEYIVENGDVIFAWSASLMVKVWDGETCVLNQHLFKVTSKEFPKWFYLQWCKYHLDEFISISSSHATTMGHIKRGDLDTAMVKVPKPEQLCAMTEQMAPLLEKQIVNAKQIKTLEKLRDNLLPKLMNGEVRII